VPVQVWRKGERKDLMITVGETPEERAGKRQPSRKPAGEAVGKLGLSVIELTAEQKREANVTVGVLVESAEGVAARAGIRRGDIILGVGNQEVKSAEDLNRLLAPQDRPRTVALLVKRGEGSLYIPLRINGN
jgi:serine protease Do